MLIAVINQSTLVTNDQVNIMCQAIQIQFNLHCAPAWNQLPPTVKFYTNLNQIPGYAWITYIIDNDAQVANALGFHQESSDKITAFIMCEPILSNGGVAFVYDPNNSSQYTVSATLSHELMEMYLDRFGGTFCTGPTNASGSNLFCQELADPVEDNSYAINVDGYQVSVSNFIFPSWTNPQATNANMPFDYLKKLTAPFTMTAGGYIITATLNSEGEVTAHHIFGEKVPRWKKDYVMGKFYRR